MMELSRSARYDMFGTVTPSDRDTVVERALHAVRTHLGMQVAYVSEFVGERSIFRNVDAPGCEALIEIGGSMALDDVYCRHILAGRLPELIPDTAAEPLAMAMAITKAAGIGAHMSVPIRLPSGEAYGMFCCIGFAADSTLGLRDLGMMRAFADLAAFEINRNLVTSKGARDATARVREVIDHDQAVIVYQPIWEIASGRAVGVESLSRFVSDPYRTPDIWFAEAAEAGLGVELETFAIRHALEALDQLPARAYLAINASPAMVLSGVLTEVLADAAHDRIVLEITEHSTIVDYPALLDRLRPLRDAGVRIAVDDAGAGYSSLRHILALQPELIRLDMSLTRNVDADPARQALVAALVAFAANTASQIIAEGVETEAELACLSRLGVGLAQGFLLARPLPLDTALEILAVPAVQHDLRARAA